MTVKVSADIHFDEKDVWHRWTPDAEYGAYGVLKFGPSGGNVYFHSTAEVDEVIAELVALRADMTGEAVTEFRSTSTRPSARCGKPEDHGPNLDGAVLDCDDAAHHQPAPEAAAESDDRYRLTAKGEAAAALAASGAPAVVTDDEPSNSAKCSRPACGHLMGRHHDYRVADKAGCEECACPQWTDAFASVSA